MVRTIGKQNKMATILFLDYWNTELQNVQYSNVGYSSPHCTGGEGDIEHFLVRKMWKGIIQFFSTSKPKTRVPNLEVSGVIKNPEKVTSEMSIAKLVKYLETSSAQQQQQQQPEKLIVIQMLDYNLWGTEYGFFKTIVLAGKWVQ